MAQLAIKGHATRGKTVIKILEMLGGMMKGKLLGTETFCAYYIDSDGSIDYKHYSRFDDAIQFTLEQFLEKFPYKVGDKVCFSDSPEHCLTIKRVWWNSDCSDLECTFHEDDINVSVKDLQLYKEQETMEEKKINQMSLANCDLDEIEIVLGDKFEIVLKNGKYYAVKKQPKYPKTYEECCEILQLEHTFKLNDLTIEEESLIKSFIRLKRCRDAYWKIAGDWKPEFRFEKKKYCITTKDNKVISAMVKETNRILVFPTKEMRDAFYENFKDLIKECKELL